MISQKGRNYMHYIKLCYPCASNVFNRGVAKGGGGGPGVPVTPLGRPSFAQTTYNIQVAKTP